MPKTLSAPVTVGSPATALKLEHVGTIIATPTAKQVAAGEKGGIVLKYVLTDTNGAVVDEGETGVIPFPDAQAIDPARYAAIATNLKPFVYLDTVIALAKFNKGSSVPTGGTVT